MQVRRLIRADGAAERFACSPAAAALAFIVCGNQENEENADAAGPEGRIRRWMPGWRPTASQSMWLGLCELRLMNDRRWPWLLLVPQRAGAEEIHDLTPLDQAMLTFETNMVAQALKKVTGCTKINTGALGNIVRQLHVHVVAAFEDDAGWPGPVWGHGLREPYQRRSAPVCRNASGRRYEPSRVHPQRRVRMSFRLFDAPLREAEPVRRLCRQYRSTANPKTATDDSRRQGARRSPARLLLMQGGRLYLKMRGRRPRSLVQRRRKPALQAPGRRPRVLLGFSEQGPVLAAPGRHRAGELPETVKAIDYRSVYMQGLIDEAAARRAWRRVRPCSPGMPAIGSAANAARNRRCGPAATSASARIAAPSISRAPTRWRSC